jgi:hypothetical protein
MTVLVTLTIVNSTMSMTPAYAVIDDPYDPRGTWTLNYTEDDTEITHIMIIDTFVEIMILATSLLKGLVGTQALN